VEDYGLQDGSSSFLALYCRFCGSFSGLVEEEEGHGGEKVGTKIKVSCTRCSGVGKVLMQKYPFGEGTAWVVCPDCKGRAWIRAELIEGIKGTVFIGSNKV
jgi:hypothetical protein